MSAVLRLAMRYEAEGYRVAQGALGSLGVSRADVACYIGKQDDGVGKQIDRWILADVRLETRQITHWKPIVEPR